MKEFAIDSIAVLMMTVALIMAQDMNIAVEKVARPVAAVLLALSGIGLIAVKETAKERKKQKQ